MRSKGEIDLKTFEKYFCWDCFCRSDMIIPATNSKYILQKVSLELTRINIIASC